MEYTYFVVFMMNCTITYNNTLVLDFSCPQCEPTSCLQLICIFKDSTDTKTNEVIGMTMIFSSNQTTTLFVFSLKIEIISTSSSYFRFFDNDVVSLLHLYIFNIKTSLHNLLPFPNYLQVMNYKRKHI